MIPLHPYERGLSRQGSHLQLIAFGSLVALLGPLIYEFAGH